MELYKIITKERQHHFYQSKASYLRGKEYHKKFLNQVKDYLPYLEVKCYELRCTKNVPHWKAITTYKVVRKQVVKI